MIINLFINTFDTNKVTVDPNGSEKIGGVPADASLSTEGQSITLVYVDGTEGWINVQASLFVNFSIVSF